MSDLTEREELNGLIDRAKAGIAHHLIEKGVKPDAATRAVNEQVRFGRAKDGKLLMKRGAWLASPVSFQRECAERILPSLAPEDMKDMSNDEEDMWTAAERRLAEASGTRSRAQLLEEKREEEIENIRGGTRSTKSLSIEELALRKRQVNPIY